MKKFNLIAVAGMALAAFGLVPAAHATGDDGDIRSIQAVPVADYDKDVGNVLSPLNVGETFYVRVRLLNENWQDALKAVPETHPWVIERNGTALPSSYKDVMYRPALRLAIGSKQVNAEFSSTGPDGQQSGLNPDNAFYTDFYFSYKVEEGELGQPIRFVDANGKIVDSQENMPKAGFNLVNVVTTLRSTGYWELTNDLDGLASFWYGPTTLDPDPQDLGTYPSEGVGDTEHMSYDKVYPGIYVQTIDFVGSDGDVEEGIWRQVYQGLDSEVGKSLAIEGVGPTTVYVWSSDETVAVPEGDVDLSVTDRTVVKITLRSDGEDVPLRLMGGTAAAGSTCKIYLCSQKNPSKNALGELLAGSTVERTVQLVAAPDPFITISRASDGARSGITLEATTNYQSCVQMRVSFTKAYEDDAVTVSLNPTVDGVALDPASHYVKILADQNGDPTVDPSISTVEVAKGEKEAFFYLFPLGADAEGLMKSAGVKFSPTTDNPYFDETKKQEALVKVTDQKPVISELTWPASAMQGDTIDLDVTIRDNWRDLQPTYNTAGYKVVVSIGGTKVESNEVHFVEEESKTFNATVPLTAEGTVSGYVRVWDATHVRSSDYVEKTFTIEVSKKPQYTATPYFFASSAADAAPIYPGEFCEGDTPVVRVVLSQIPSTDVYAFLVPDSVVAPKTSEIVSTTATSQGLLISKDSQNPTNSAATMLSLLDGDAKLPHETMAKFKVVLKDGADYATATEITTYECKSLMFDVTNAVPTVQKVYKDTADTGTEIKNGATYGGTLPSGSPVNFTAKVYDRGSLDLEDTANPIKVKWVWTDGPDGNNPEQTPVKTDVLATGYSVCPITFYEAGVEQTVSLYAQDRDTRAVDENEFGELLYTFKVKIGEQPRVIINYPADNLSGLYYETGNKKYNKINVQVSDYPASTDHAAGEPAIGTTAHPLQIRLTVDNDYHSDAGVLKLVDPKTSAASDSVVVEFVKTGENKSGKDVFFDLPSQNGGADDPTMFMIKAEVINEEKNQYDTAWKDYFLSAESEVDMQNVDPTLKIEPGDSTHSLGATNTWTAGEVVSVKWTVGDILRDLKSGTFRVSWTLTDTNGVLFTTVDSTKVSGSTASATASGLYTFKVPDVALTEVTVTAEDGDGGLAERKFYIRVVPTKKISINVFGPAASTLTKYDTAGGLGRGHVYVEESTGQYLVRGFQQTWNYNEAMQQAHVYAAGYPAAEGDAYDNGRIDAGYTGAPLTPEGGKQESSSGPFYNYGNSAYDNYFYRWAQYGGEDGESDTMSLLDPNPTKSPSAIVGRYFTLDNEEKEDSASYNTVQIEAIFSQELLPSDNCGDINADGVPDLYAKKFTDLGVFGDSESETESSGDDLKDLSESNVDEDYFPNTMSAAYAAFVPDLSDTWVMQGRAFTTRMEIRGYDDHLNDATLAVLNDGTLNKACSITGVTPELRYTDPRTDDDSTLSLLEYIAYTNWCGRMGYADPENHWNAWTPERPTSPVTTSNDDGDTDGDGVPDGYEYYFWYKSHVGYFTNTADPTTFTRLTGRRYNPGNPCEPIVITADEVEAILDPLKKNTDLTEADTDNDGLPDLIEFEIGTNPIDYDTDSDDLPDGYELLLSGYEEAEDSEALATRSDDSGNLVSDPLRYASNSVICDGLRNDDIDQMAYTTNACARVSIVTDENGETVTNDCYVSTVDASRMLTAQRSGGPSKLQDDIWVFKTWLYRKPDLYAQGEIVYTTGILDQLRLKSAKEFIVNTKDIDHPIDILIFHFQVYETMGFDPRTGWNGEPCYEKHRIDTDAYTRYDEFMMMALCYQAGGLTTADITPTKERTFFAIWTDCTTSPMSADTDEDGIPDGWELYTMTGPGVMGGQSAGPGSPYSPLSKFDYIKGTKAANPDVDRLGSPAVDTAGKVDEYGDHLGFDLEWCGVECCAWYELTDLNPSGCATISNKHPEWKNKIWPTDPWSLDTDGDGLKDGEEGHSDSDEINWIYGENEHQEADYSDCVEGGGLNPLSWDTDFDGLPDPWEDEFGDTIIAATTTGEGTNAVTTAAHAAGEGMNPTLEDTLLDYDHDGLNNWQEYLVGAMRCWRYDDVTTPWVSHSVTADDYEKHRMDDDWWGHVLLEQWPDEEGKYNEYAFNPGLRNGYFDHGAYFTCCGLAWELNGAVYGKFYMFKDGVDHDLLYDKRDDGMGNTVNRLQCVYNQQTIRHSDWTPTFDVLEAPHTYISCDPRNADSDGDGMDDGYEIFHGLNPLLGAAGRDEKDGPIDVVYRAWKVSDADNPPSAKANLWIDDGVVRTGTFDMHNPGANLKYGSPEDDRHSIMDFHEFPWLTGLADADCDGDNIRNQQESILPKVQAAATYQHTDPTPLWMTDTSYTNSLTARYYQAQNPVWAETVVELTQFSKAGFTYRGKYYLFNDFPWLHYDEQQFKLEINYDVNKCLNRWNYVESLFNYEENEGFDSDHDYLGDFEESQGRTKASSDPQEHDDPIRHQAMWFNGRDAFLQTPLPMETFVPTNAADAEVRQNFLYFTAEAWVKADAAIVDADGLYTVLERAIWTGESNPADESFLRKNFLIGINNGRWYAKFDSAGTDLKQYVEIDNGPIATTNWTHLAATYGPADDDESDATQPMALRLYVNGICQKYKNTALQPEHGASAVYPTPTGELKGKVTWKLHNYKPMISILVGASANTKKGVAFENGWETRMQYSAASADNPALEATVWPHVNEDDVTTFSDYASFFKGYVDEVRIWDGARTAADIAADVKAKTRYTAALAEKNRQNVYVAWAQGALRSASGTAGTSLPPELLYHWTFDHVPGAVSTGDVLQTPAGFTTTNTMTDAKAIWSRPLGWTSDRWTNTVVRSTVYADGAWVPWINNTVSHLPCIDGTTADSVYWSENYAGYDAATWYGYTSFAFPRTAEVWSSLVQNFRDVEYDEDYQTTQTRWELVRDQPVLKGLYRFNYRNRESIGKDLLPMGGAYPKRISATEGGMWDDACAADAWAEVGTDADNNALPDWWEKYARRNLVDLLPGETLEPSTPVNYGGITMTAMRAYLRDVARGMLSDGKYHPEFADTRDADKDAIPDWWESLYGIDTGSASDALADNDNDGLSNLAEYRVEADGVCLLDPTLARTEDSQFETDYFLKTPDGRYLGEAYADHDFMEDLEEDAMGADRTLYDAYSDLDEDGWSAFAERRYSAFKMGISARFISHLVGEEEVRDYPIPVIHTTLRYNGDASVTTGGTVVVEAYAGNNLQKAPTATWSVTRGDSQTRYLYLGKYENRIVHGTLTPGHVLVGMDKAQLQMCFVQSTDLWSWQVNGQPFKGTYDEMWKAYSTDATGTNVVVNMKAYGWDNNLINAFENVNWLQFSVDQETQKGDILLDHEKAGTIDAVTGDFSFDLSKLAGLYLESKGVAMEQCFFRIEYSTQIPTLQTQAMTVSLAAPDEGTLTEGTCAFAAYIDRDADGAFTPGTDPIGYVKDVSVGWDNVTDLVIEMTDSSQAAGQRFAIPDDAAAIRVIRTTVNGQEKIGNASVKRRIVYSRTAADVARKSVFEADLVTGSKFGLDWANLRGDLQAMDGLSLKDVTSVGYVVVTNTGSVLNLSADDIVTSFTVEYSADATKPVCVSPSDKAYGIVETQRPTFKWTASDGYTAFRLEIGDKGGQNWFYDSGLKTLPPRDSSLQYFWTAPVYIGENAANDATTLVNNSNYLWRVAMYNAKFSNTNDATSAWSDPAPFTTALAETNDFSTIYGSANVSVRYYGPATNALRDVFVELYASADLTGTPAARARLLDLEGAVDSLTNGSTVAFHGLADGDYYAVAYVDRNRNEQREKYETWGYSAQIGIGTAAIWTPTSLTSDAHSAAVPSIELFMEDTDINQNGILDIFDDEEILKDADAGSTGADTSDVDGDGLTADDETGDTYTDKTKWDTDGDGMPDGWEARFADTDPLLPDADTVVAGDVMAFAVTGGVYRLVSNAAGEQYLVRDTNGTYRVGDVLSADKLLTTYDYVTIAADETGTNFVKTTLSGLGTNLIAGADFKIDTIAAVDVALVHAQVYDEFGYSRKTAIETNDVHTKAFTALDKYMLVRYLAAIGIRTANEEKVNLSQAWKDCTLKTLDTDNDRDGVADGWELYVMFGTNGVKSAGSYAKPADTPINPWKFDDRNVDLDGDTLSLVDEYSKGNTPSDPWNEYSVYDELFAAGILPEGAKKFTDDKARRFAISEDMYENDDDIDQIKNAQEMWAYYLDMENLKDIDHENAWSDGTTPDYFRACGSSYLGEIYNGAEFIEFRDREALDITSVSRMGTRDYFQSGWDVWSLVRFNVAKNESTDTHTKIVNYFVKFLTIRYGDNYTGTTEGDAIAFQNAKCGHTHTTAEQCVSCVGGLDAVKQLIAENGTTTLTAAGYDIPDPTVYLTLKYMGNDSQPLVVEAYQSASTYPEYGEQMVARWTQDVLFDSGIAYAKLEVPGKGTLKQGRTRFVAYFDVDGESGFTPGDIYGTTTLNVGYMGATGTIRFADPIADLPVLTLDSSNTVLQTIAIVRTKVNGREVTPRGVALRRYLNNVNRTCVFPSEYIDARDGFIGLDKYLAYDPMEDMGDPTEETLPNVETVTYEIVKIPANNAVEGDEAWKISVTNLNHYSYIEVVETEDGESNVVHTVDQDVNEIFTVRYSLTRDVPLEVTGDAASLVGSAILSFAIPTDRAVTKFWLEIDGHVTNLDGYLLDCAVGGRVILDGDWFRENNVTLAQGERKVRVALGNDKFPESPTDDDQWSATATFNVNAAAVYDGKLAVRVLHPNRVELGAKKVTVAVYEQCDLAEPFKTYTEKSTNDVIVLDGLRTGAEYYVAAWYVKDAADGRSGSSKADATVRMPYDTWGYLTMLGRSTNGFDAASVKVAAKTSVTNVIYLQDTDWNANGVIDRDETIKSVPGLTASAAPDWLDFDCDGVLDTDDSDPVFDNSDDALEYDVMAYATKTLFCVRIGTVDLTTNWVWYAVTDVAGETCADKLGNGSIVIPRGTSAASIATLASTYTYGRKSTAPLGIGTNVTLSAGKVYDYAWKELVLVHDQVYREYGFNPLTANAFLTATAGVNTKKFTSLDKYIVTNYLAAVGALAPDAVHTNWVLNAKRIDFDYDGIPDGWELYTMFGPNAASALEKTAKKTVLNAWVYGDRNLDADDDTLTNLHEYDGGNDPTDPWNKDTDGDGITDNYACTYHLKGDDADRDFDGDGLCNNAEYLISEVFQVAKLDPDDPKTDGSCIDYFRKMGELYLGEIFTDHDQVDDLWEAGFADSASDGKAYANRAIYDPSRDADGDGWSNYAESKAGTNPELIQSTGIDGYTLAEHPVPMIEAHVTYNGRYNAIVAPLVFKAWNEAADADMVMAPDAIWTVAASSTTTDDETSDDTTADTTSDSATNREKYLGKNPCEVRTLTLGPGVVSPGTVRVYFRDQAWQRATVYNGTEISAYTADSSAARWHALVQDLDGVLYTSVTNETESTAVGTVDYTTGRLTLNLASPALTRSVYATMANAASSQTSGSDTTAVTQYYNCEKLNLAKSYVKIGWTSTVIGTSIGGTYYLGDADKPGTSATTLTRGYVREGAAKFVAFADLDGSGEYTAGEPFGFVHSVDVGWQGAKFSVDLTDTHPVFARLSLTDGSSDRALWSTMSTTIHTNGGSVTEAPSGNVRVRVVRTAVNGKLMTDMKNPSDPDEYAPETVVMDKTFNTSVRSYLHEGDFLTATNPDIDWATLASDAEKYQPVVGDNKWGWPANMTSVTYRVVFGDGLIHGVASNGTSTLSYTVDRCFDTSYNTVKTVITPFASVTTYNTRPVFKWAITEGKWNYGSYPTFKVEVLSADRTTVLYDSGLQPMRDYEVVNVDGNSLHYYVWTAPSIVDNLLTTGGRIARNGTYKWRVTVYNSKYRTGKASEFGTLTTVVNETYDAGDHTYSAIPVTVKYTGPATVLSKAQDLSTLLGKVRVQAFETADFSGEPLSETLVTTNLADTAITTANGTLYGLPANGTYYLRAYIDSNGNCTKDDWESWGAAASGVAAGETTPAGIYIEDADTDDDWLPDAWEFAKAGWDDYGDWLSNEGKDVSGEFIVTEKLKTAVENGTLMAGIAQDESGAPLTVFTYDTVAKLVCGSDTYSFESVNDIRRAVAKKVKAGTLAINSITLDPDGSKVVLGVGAETAQTIAGRLISQIYDFTGATTTVRVKVYKKASLVENWGETPVCTKDVTISENLSTFVPVSIDGVDMSSGFFKVEVEEVP